jgi:Putative porin
MFALWMRRLLGPCVTVALMAPLPLWGQDQPEIGDVASALAAERARIAELQSELEHRSAALAELARRLEAIAPASAATQAPAAPPAEKTAAAVPPPRFDLYGESKVRYETLQQDYPGCEGCPNRQRGRLRLRFGAEGRLAPDFRAVVGFGVGELNDPNTVYVNLGNNFSRKVASWDRGFVEYHPVKAPWIDLTAGKFPYTWLRSSMTFDVDFYPEGMSERFAFNTPRAGWLKQVGAQGFQLIVNEQPIDQHMTVVGGQFTAKLQPTARSSTSVVVTGVEIRRPEFLLRALLDGSDVGVRNTNAVVFRDGRAYLASGFRYANVIVENALQTRWEVLPVTIGVEYQRNLEAASNPETGLSFRLDAGRAQRRGDWEFGWHVFHVEQDAILAGLGESDWRAPSNVLQHRFVANRMVHPNVQLSFTLYSGRTLDRTLPGAVTAPNLLATLSDPWTNRLYLDVTYRY